MSVSKECLLCSHCAITMAATTQETVSQIQTRNESWFFVEETIARRRPTTKGKCQIFCHLRYRMVCISEKGAVFMIVLNAFFVTAVVACMQSINVDNLPFNYVTMLEAIPFVAVVLFLPVIGLLSDCYLGRYKILLGSICFLLIAMLSIAINAVATPNCMWYVTSPPLILASGCYMFSIVPFTMDQLIGASGAEISFTIYWILWPVVTCALTSSFFCRFLPSENYQLFQAILFSLTSVCFAVVFCMIRCCDHVLMMKTPQISNPIKLTLQVLNYARRHKFPERRSAFTYWEEECPSRIDLGKSKYGGTFTVEEVENVKTILNLTLLVNCIAIVVAFGIPEIKIASSNLHNMLDKRFSVLIPWYLLTISYLPIYQFLTYPFLYNCIPAMLRRIGCGLVLVIISQVFIFSNELLELYTRLRET